MDCYNVFSHIVFFMFFSKIIFVNFIFLILSWLKITITSKAKSCGENTVTFLTKHYGLIQFFLTWFFSSFFCVFFVIFFFKIISVDVIFLILSWLEFNFVIKLNMWGKHCNFPHKTLWIATVSLHIVYSSYDFFLNYLCQFFFNIELVEN